MSFIQRLLVVAAAVLAVRHIFRLTEPPVNSQVLNHGSIRRLLPFTTSSFIPCTVSLVQNFGLSCDFRSYDHYGLGT